MSTRPRADSPTPVTVRLFGAVVLEVGGTAVQLPSARQRALLAALALTPARVVPADQLMERVWDGAPPAQARNTLYTYVARLRRALGDSDRGARVLGSTPGGYVLDLPESAVDVARFRQMLALAQVERTGPEPRSRILREALDLVPGEPLAGLAGDWAERVRHGLRETWLEAWVRWARCRLELGDAATVLHELTPVAAEHPLCEPLAAALVTAQCVAGRPGQALGTYAAVRRRLVATLGTEPGPELRAAQALALAGQEPAGRAAPAPGRALPQPAVLHPAAQRSAPPRPAAPQEAGPSLTVPHLTVPHPTVPYGAVLHPPAPPGAAGGPARPGAAAVATSTGAAPAQLPPVAAHFTGREAQLAQLDGLLDRSLGWPRDAPGPNSCAHMMIAAVSGTAGVGKSALAVRWAHSVSDRFPDGQLYIDLRGYDEDQPVRPAEALGRFLHALGVTGDDVPPHTEDRAATFRSLVSGRRLLVVLDNASSAEQVRPLLPGTVGCAVVVTSRDTLAGLVVRDGATRVPLDLLPLQDAVHLLGALVGGRVTDEPQAARDLVRQCARLPLALRVAADLAVARPRTRLADLAAELGDERDRLDMLDAGGDPRSAVRSVFSWSLRHLPGAPAHLFALLGLHPVPVVTAEAVAALAGIGRGAARRGLDVLVRASLLQPRDDGRRYAMHDLLHAYAVQMADAGMDDDARAAARERMVSHYVSTAAAAVDLVHHCDRGRHPWVAPPGPGAPADEESARAWLDAERPALIGISAYATHHGDPADAVVLARVLARHLLIGGHYTDALVLHANARAAARRSGDVGAQARALTDLGAVHFRRSDYDRAVHLSRQALLMFRLIEDRAGEAAALTNLGLAHYVRGGFATTVDPLTRALALHRSLGDRLGEAYTLRQLGLSYYRWGNDAAAAEYLDAALTLFRELRDRYGQARTLCDLGQVHHREGRYDEALRRFRSALELDHSRGHRSAAAHVRCCLAETLLATGRPGDAAETALAALAAYRELGIQNGEAKALNAVGRTLHAAGRHQDAVDRLTEALGLAVQVGDRFEEARAYAALGEARLECGDGTAARLAWSEAHRLYVSVGVPEADEAGRRLAELGGAPQAADRAARAEQGETRSA